MKANIWSEKKLLAQKQLSLQLAFTMTLGLIHPWNWSSISTESPEYYSLAQRVRADYHGEDFTSSNQSFWLSWEGLHTRSLQLAGLIAYVLKIGGFEDMPRSDLIPLLRDTSHSNSATTTSSRAPRLKVPLLEKTSSGSGGGIRGQANSWQEWYTTRVRDLVNTIDDDDDEWYGYYVYGLTSTDNLNPIGSKDPAMENIHFKLGRAPPTPTTPTHPSATAKKRSPSSTPTNPTPAPQKLPLEARACQDGITCSFDFVGTVAPATGIVSLRKNYVGAHYWDYEGVMTPLGIVGEWGKEGAGFNGYFWLWKRSWMMGGGGGDGGDGRGQRTYAYS
ncbi:hypothetical protein Daus18300_003240 [Diaporthe australafricana]|uniref:Uncharacterized protein n=1 Tax=Diaporthe australafricana TaxID=127596 RepID=A0ABR3XHL4_9PEZI